MYESFYGLKWRPFAAAPDPAGFVAVGHLKQSLAALRMCVEAGQGIGILTAPAGMGKTLVLRKLMAELRDTFANVFLANSNFTSRRALLQAIQYELGQPYTNMDEQELRLALTSTVRNMRSRRKAVLLAVDEAQFLEEELLDEIRSITNLVEDGEPLFRILVSGQLLLEEKLASPSLQSLNQRIGCHVTLESFSRIESAEYIKQRLRWAGAEIAKVFAAEAVEQICHAADGVPRAINHLCDHSLLLGYVKEMKPVSTATVLEALDDLRQLPLQWNEPLITAKSAETGDDSCNPGDKTRAASNDKPSAVSGERPAVRPVRRPSPFAEGAGVIEFGAPESASNQPGTVPADDSRLSSGAKNVQRKDANLWQPEGDGWIDPVLSCDDEAVGAADTIFYGTDDSDELEPVDGEFEMDWEPADSQLFSDSLLAAEPEIAEEDFIAVSDSEWDAEPSEAEFEEEVVFDRYAALDAGKERSTPPVAFGRRPSPAAIIDSVNPLIDEALETGCFGGECGDDDLHESAAGLASEQNLHYYDAESDLNVEEQIGEDVLDTCIETHQAIFGRTLGPDTSSDRKEASGARCDSLAPLLPVGDVEDDRAPEEEYDIVEPETDGLRPTPPVRRDPPDRGRAPSDSPDARRHSSRHCEQLFSELRRRKK